jgi:hypothetical protein
MEFMSVFDTQERDGIISWSEFVAVLGDVSFSSHSDEAFGKMLEDAFKC